MPDSPSFLSEANGVVCADMLGAEHCSTAGVASAAFGLAGTARVIKIWVSSTIAKNSTCY